MSESSSTSSTEEKKSQLSHALSLPLEEKNERSIRKQQSLRIKPVSKPVLDDTSVNPVGIKDRSWSFGNVAKAVGSGVTAFGSGVVQGTKVVGSGVVQGTKVVGSGVVQGTMVVGSGVVSVGTGVVQVGTSVGTGVVHGTKMAGRVTKDVTMAAGKGVFTAGEMVSSVAVSGVSAVGTATVSAGMAVGEASATALCDTTKWVKEKRSRILLPGQEFDEHDLLPGESLESVSMDWGVDIEILILINELKSRNLLSGTKILLPNAELKKTLTGKKSVLPFTHCMDHVRIRVVDSLSFLGVKRICIATEFYRINEEELMCLTSDIEEVHIDQISEEEECSLPELLPPNALEEERSSEKGSNINDDRVMQNEEVRRFNEGLVFEVDTKSITSTLTNAPEKDLNDYKFKLVLVQRVDEDKKMVYFVNNEDLFILVKFLELWTPKRLTMSNDVRRIVEAKQFDLDFGEEEDDFLRLPTLISLSQVLTEAHIRHIYKFLPPQNQNESWLLEYSTSSDGFSLQNLYRRLANCREPILITVQDYSNVVFGAFLTCIPQHSEVFIGNGNSWLFSSHGGDGEDVQIYTWTGLNDYFCKGDSNNIIIGGGDGKFGLLIDSDLNRGRTDCCLTFNNEPLTTHDFHVKCLECWSFI